LNGVQRLVRDVLGYFAARRSDAECQTGNRRICLAVIEQLWFQGGVTIGWSDVVP